MPIDFPDNPTNGTQYTNPSNSNVYVFSNGSWSLQTILSSARGGTGFASYDRGDILYGNSSGTLSKLGAGTAGSVLSTGGPGADPSWITLSAGGAGTVATPGTQYQIAGYYPGTGASVSGSATFTNDASGGIVSITHATASASTTTGALVVSGGVGIANTSYFGQSVFIQGTTASGSTTTGALVVSGGVGIGGSLNVYSLSKFSDHLEIKTQKELRLYNSGDSFYVALKAGNVASSSKTFTLPITTGNSGEYLQTDGTGVLTWAAVTSGVSAVNAGAGISIPSTTGSVTVSIGRPVVLNMASGFTPVGIGTDYNILRVPEGKNNTNANYNIRKVVMGVGTTSSGTSTIRVEKSIGPHTSTSGFNLSSTGSTSNAMSADLSLLSGLGETSWITFTSGYGTAATGDRIRLNFTAVDSTHANFIVQMLLEEY
jgi:hypothetical protein